MQCRMANERRVKKEMITSNQQWRMKWEERQPRRTENEHERSTTNGAMMKQRTMANWEDEPETPQQRWWGTTNHGGGDKLAVRNDEPRWRWRTTNLRWLCEVRTQRQRGGFAKWEHRGGEVACGGRARWLSMQARRRIWNEGGRTESQKMGWERENWEIENEMRGAERGFSGSHVWKQFSLKTM